MARHGEDGSACCQSREWEERCGASNKTPYEEAQNSARDCDPRLQFARRTFHTNTLAAAASASSNMTQSRRFRFGVDIARHCAVAFLSFKVGGYGFSVSTSPMAVIFVCAPNFL